MSIARQASLSRFCLASALSLLVCALAFVSGRNEVRSSRRSSGASELAAQALLSLAKIRSGVSATQGWLDRRAAIRIF